MFYFWQDVGGTVRSRLCRLLTAKFNVYSNTVLSSKGTKSRFLKTRTEAQGSLKNFPDHTLSQQEIKKCGSSYSVPGEGYFVPLIAG